MKRLGIGRTYRNIRDQGGRAVRKVSGARNLRKRACVIRENLQLTPSHSSPNQLRAVNPVGKLSDDGRTSGASDKILWIGVQSCDGSGRGTRPCRGVTQRSELDFLI